MKRDDVDGLVHVESWDYSYASISESPIIHENIKKITTNGDTKIEKSYDASGRIIEYKCYNQDKLISVKEYEYDENIKTIKTNRTGFWNGVLRYSYYFNMQLILINKYKFDEHGNEIEERQLNYSHPAWSGKTLFFYDENNKIKTRKLYDAKNRISGKVKYEHDSEGNCVKIVSLNSKGKLDYKYHFYYSEGIKIRESCFNMNGCLAWDLLIAFNSEGKKVEKKYIKQNLVFYKENYKFDSEGRRILTEVYVDKTYIDKWINKSLGFHLPVCRPGGSNVTVRKHVS